MAGYHIRDIKKGKLGELSKVREELEEALDADEQNNPIMVLHELSDLIGAIKHFIAAQYGDSLSFEDLETMEEATQRAFEEGRRTND